MLVRFGYDLFEHEHPWDGEWIDDAFEAAAIDLRSTVAKLLRALDEIDDVDIDVERTPLHIDLAVSYLERMRRDIAVAVPCCFGTDGRRLSDARGDLAAMAAAVTALDVDVARTLTEVCSIDLDFATHDPELFRIIDAAGERSPLPKATARLRATSTTTTRISVGQLDDALVHSCTAFDHVLASLQRAIARRAEDGSDLLQRWSRADWSVVGAATPAATRHLPRIDEPAIAAE